MRSIRKQQKFIVLVLVLIGCLVVSAISGLLTFEFRSFNEA